METTIQKRVAWNKGMKGLQPWHNISGFNPGWNKGMKGIFSKEALESNRKKHLGIPPPNKGKRMSDEQKKKLSEIKKGKTGELCNAWKGGFTAEYTLIRSSLEGKLWKQSIFARDGYTCQKTGVKGGNLVAHHILNFSSSPELRFAIDNGITLSKESHREFHIKYGKRNNTKEQLVEFLTGTEA
jgi:hypothetical protein